MEQGTGTKNRLDLPEHRDEFDEAALERAILENRRREFAELAQLNN